MTKTPTLLAIVGLTVAVVAWQLYDRAPEPAIDKAGSTADTASQVGTEPTGVASSPMVEPSASTPNSVNEEQTTAVTEDPSCIPNTRWIQNPITGEMVESENCYPIDDPDPYESWDDATLVGMAYADAHAAEVLGLRHIRSEDPDTEAMGLALLYRSVALSGDPETFKKAIGARYAYLSMNGEPQMHNLKQQLLFKLVGQTMGDPWFNPKPVIRDLREAGVSDSDIDQARLAARQVLETMADLQTEMTGESSLQEALNEGALADA